MQPDPAGKTVASTQTIAWLEFECADGSTKLGVWDWVGEIYFSYIRAPRVLVRGDQGEISDSTVRYLEGPTEPMEFELRRLDAGVGGQPDTLEGVYHKGYLGGGEYLERNGLARGAAAPRLTDDELANAVTLAKMSECAPTPPALSRRHLAPK